MPFGILIYRFDEKAGMKVVAKHPEDILVDDKATMQIYTAHAFEGEKGFLTISIADLNIASYFTGMDSNYYIGLLLSIDENAEDYEDVLTDSVRIIMSNLEYRRYIQMLPEIYKKIVTYPTMTREQHLALVFLDPVKKLILDRLIEDGSATKSELTSWLKEKLVKEELDMDAILHSMIKMGLIVESTLKELPSPLVFLVGDIFTTRVPPTRIVSDAKAGKYPGHLSNEYISDVRTFFEGYSPTPEDQEVILKVLTDIDAFKVIYLLQDQPLSREDVDRLRGEIENLDAVLKWLWDAKIINVLRGKTGQEVYFLRSNIAVKLVFPEYIINLILESYSNGTKSDNVLIEHLNVLKETFYNVHA
ncbi:MAG: hypothetical protein EU536_02285 [Promethearchaeota archaeon]|nr:MAG: hypothetical protein EU536_02285 [Candidatus Lokiarchaeota archaeon]